MKWTVVWKIEVEEQLASLWMQTADKKAFSEAVNAIEKRLSKKPLELGESRWGLRRILFEYPLCILYEAIPDDCLVNIIAAWEP